MSRQKELYKKMHPEQFSDSLIVKKAQLDRNFLDYFLDTISSRSLEKNFEQFCQQIIEAELCPNLITQTGPTGGGDSKVDSETFPVSETLTETWFYGNGNKSGTERWAFAISAKKEWRGKVKLDVKKIVDVNNNANRGYTRIFFLSNQFISDKKRSETEDDLHNKYNIDVRILDKNWLLDKVYSKDGNKVIAIECFGLSENLLDEKKIGTRDYSRQNEMKKIEEKLSKPTKLKVSEFIPLAKRCLVLGRELELSEHDVLGLMDRYKRLANEYGNKIDIVESIYECAWTIYWWYNDVNKFYRLYLELEKNVLGEKNVHLFEKLVIQWVNLYALKMEELDINIKQHTEKIIERYQFFISDETKPNTILLAKNAYQVMRVFIGDDINDIVNDYIDLINKSNGSLEFDLYPIGRMVQELSIYEKAERYDELFELVVEKIAQENKNADVGSMLAKRGHALKEERPYEALSYFSRTLRRFYNEANKDNLIKVVLEMGKIFENIGLYWAARNFYFYDFCLCLNQYMKQGEISPALLISANLLKLLELRLGRILYSIEFDFFEKIAKNIYPEKFEQSEDNYDYMMGLQIFRTPFEKLLNIEKLPGYLEERQLIFTKVATEFELGHYDEEILKKFNYSEEAFDDFISKWKDQPALSEFKGKPWYGFEESINIESRVLGCKINIVTDTNGLTIEFASSVLATIECFLGTGINNDLISMAGKIRIYIAYKDSDVFNINIAHTFDRPSEINIEISNYSYKDYIEAQEKIGDALKELLGIIVAIMFPINEQFEKIKEMTEKEESLVRTDIFANSIFMGIETMGKDAFSFERLTLEYDQVKLMRTSKSLVTRNHDKKDRSNKAKDFEIVHDKPPEEYNFKNTSNEDIFTSPVINISLWNRSSWKGVMFIVAENNKFSPIIAPAFESKVGINIFEEWIKDIGEKDVDNQIGIRIIKGIDKNHPTWYRVIIGAESNLSANGKNRIVISPVRLHTMQAESDINLKRFENSFSKVGSYCICPAVLKGMGQTPNVLWDKKISKKQESIIICNAWEVPENDLLFYSGIMPTDNPIIPRGKENSPILKIIKRKRKQ